MTHPNHSVVSSNSEPAEQAQLDIDSSVAQSSAMQAQLIELQMSMAHLERTIEQLDQVVTRQDHDIHQLERQLKLLVKQLQNQQTDEGIAPFDVIADKPPHY